MKGLPQPPQGSWLQTHALDANSRFRFQWRAGATGVYNFRIRADGDSTHLAGYSRTFEVTVR